jgi:hypothetical protein
MAAPAKAVSWHNTNMLKAWSFIWRWIGNLLRVETLWKLLPAGVAAVLTGYFTSLAYLPVWIIVPACSGAAVLAFLIVRRFQADSSAQTRRDINYHTYVAQPAHPEKEEPQIIAHWEFSPTKGHNDFPHFRLMVQNTGKAVAVNISALPMISDIPQGHRSWAKALVEHSVKQAGNNISGNIDDYTPREWEASFESIDKLTVGSVEQELSYRFKFGMGWPQQDIASVLERFVGNDLTMTRPFAIVFSDTSNPRRIWRTDYELVFHSHPEKERQRIELKFQQCAEVVDGKCLGCTDPTVFPAPAPSAPRVVVDSYIPPNMEARKATSELLLVNDGGSPAYGVRFGRIVFGLLELRIDQDIAR